MPIFSTPAVWIALMNVFNSVAFATAATAVLNFVAITAATMAASKLLAPKPPSFSDASLSQRSQMVRSPISARNLVYGRCRVSGTVVYMSTTGSKNEYLHIVVTLAGHEIEEIQEVYFNDELVPLVSNTPTGFYNGVARVNKHLGETTQTADSDLITDTASLTDGKWTSDHKLSGIAYLYVRLTWDTEKFPSGIPNISAVIKGKKVYDPRSTATAYSANAALCLRDYLTDSALGMGLTSGEVDDTAITAAANICDEQVQVLPLSPTTYENRYECNGVIATSAAPDENIGKLLSAMGGLIAYSGGKVVPYAGGYRIPTVTLSEKHFVGPLNIQTRTSARDRVNSVKGVYVSEGNGWQVSDFPSISSSTYVSNDNGIRYWRDVVLPFTTSSSCAQRLGVIELRRAREEITFSARFRLEAMQVRAGDTVMITNAKLGWSSKVFEVMEWHFATDGSPPQLYIDMTLRETASSVYSWTVSDEIAVDDAPNTTLPDPFTLGAPSSLALTADGTTQFIQADGTAVPRIKVKWTPPSEEFIQSGGAVVIEYKPTTSTTYLTWSRVEGAQTEDYISSDVRIGTAYDVRIFGESYFKISTSYVSSAITVSPDTTPPAVPTGLYALVGTGQIVSLDWSDNTEPDFGEYGVWRHTAAITASATKIAETRASRFVDVDVSIGTTYYYWISAFDRSENESSKCAFVSAVPTVVPSGSIDPALTADVATALANASTAITNAATAQATADGKVTTFVGTSAPTAEGVGDLWVDTDDGNKLYRWNGSAWVEIQDDGIAEALTDAANAQATADGKIVTFYATSAPTADAVGDLWVDTDDENRLYRWSGSAWVDVQGISTTAPSNPSAPTVASTGTYLSGDGTVLSRITLNIPAMPSGAKILNVLYRKTGGTGWIVADQRSAGGSTSVIDDLTPGVTYDIAVQAFSAFGIGSGIVTGTSQLAPNNSTAPADPTGGGLTKDGVTPKLVDSTREYFFASRAYWSANTEADFDHYEIKATAGSGSGATDYSWANEGGVIELTITKALTMCFYNTLPTGGFVHLRAVNRSGVASSWVYLGSCAANSFYGSGTVGAQDSDDVYVSAVKTGSLSASSVRQIAAVYKVSDVPTLTGGAPTETFAVDISNRGFSTKPDVGIAACANDANIVAAYDFDHASNSSSTAYVRAATVDGSNIGGGSYRFSIEFTEYN